MSGKRNYEAPDPLGVLIMGALPLPEGKQALMGLSMRITLCPQSFENSHQDFKFMVFFVYIPLLKEL